MTRIRMRCINKYYHSLAAVRPHLTSPHRTHLSPPPVILSEMNIMARPLTEAFGNMIIRPDSMRTATASSNSSFASAASIAASEFRGIDRLIVGVDFGTTYSG